MYGWFPMGRDARQSRYPPPVHVIRLTKEQEIAPCAWVRQDEETVSPRTNHAGTSCLSCLKANQRLPAP